jgi:ABC-type glycerol-3-phosphate transport system permease component
MRCVCGCEQRGEALFCKGCGAPLYAGAGSTGPQPWMPLTPDALRQARSSLPSSRVRQNLQPMGIVWCLWGVYRLVMGLIAGIALRTMVHHHVWFDDGSDFIPGFLASFLPILAVSTVVMSLLALVTGWALLTAKSWGRTLAIIVAILTLIKIPLGTALGVYTLWVLAPRTSGVDYDAMAAGMPDHP